MPRTVVPPVGVRGGGAGQPGDDLPTRLAKYVPAETLAFFVPATAAIGTGHKGLVALVTLAAAVGSLGVLWLNAVKLPDDERPLRHFYVLAVVAFLSWAIATSPSTADLVGVDATSAGVV